MPAVLLLVAAVIRLDSITAPPLDFAPARQTYGALRARVIYLGGQRDVDPWRLRVVDDVRPEIPQIEPPVLEHLAAAAYRIAGSEQVWIARLFSVVFWLAGAAFLYRLATRVGGSPVPAIAMSVYLFLPLAIVGSRSFQPDPLMVALTLGALVAVVRYHEHPTRVRLLAAAGVSALAVLSKPMIPAFFLLTVFFALANRRRRFRLTARDGVTYIVLTLAPAAAYSFYGLGTGGYLEGRTSSSIQPQLLADPAFWRGWLAMVSNVVAYPLTGLTGYEQLASVALLALVAVPGVRSAQSGTGRRLLVGLWGAYALFGLAFTVHISTHPYYSLPLIPVIALSVAPLLANFVRLVDGASFGVKGGVLAAALGVAVLIGWKVDQTLRSPEYARQAHVYERIGAAVGHTSDAVHVDDSFNTPLLYYAWISSSPLFYPGGDTLAAQTLRERLRDVAATSGSPRFLIVTATEELARQPALQELVGRLSPIARERTFALWEFPR